MHTVELLEEAIALAERVGFQVRQEWLGGSGGGDCEIKGQKWIFLDLAVGPLDQLELVLETLRREQRTQISQSRDVVVTAAAELQRQIKQAAAALKKARSQTAVEQARRTLNQARTQINSADWQPVADAGAADSPIAVGDTVWLPEIGVSGTVTALDAARTTAEVQAGATRVRLGLDKLRFYGSGAKREPRGLS